MHAPEFNYRLVSARDVSGSLIDIVKRNLWGSDTNVNAYSSVYTVPGSKVLLMTAASLIFTPGTGQAPLRGSIHLVGETQSDWIDVAYFTEAGIAANERAVLNWVGELWVPPGENLRGWGRFDAGTNENTITLMFHGLLIPRGDIQEA